MNCKIVEQLFVFFFSTLSTDVTVGKKKDDDADVLTSLHCRAG